MSALDAAKARLAKRQRKLAEATKKLAALRKRVPFLQGRVKNTQDTIERLSKPKSWHPDATKVPYASAGPFVVGNPKLVWHTTEGSSLPTYSGSAPHFTLDPKSGKLWQHIPITQAAKALMHPAGTVETNRASAIQVELIGFASQTQNWSEQEYTRVASLARWIEANAGVRRACGVKFTGSSVKPNRMTPTVWLAYNGHCGHQHVPNNDHWDPGAFRIDLVV